MKKTIVRPDGDPLNYPLRLAELVCDTGNLAILRTMPRAAVEALHEELVERVLDSRNFHDAEPTQYPAPAQDGVAIRSAITACYVFEYLNMLDGGEAR